MHLKEICFQALGIVKETGAYIRTERKHFENIQIESKGVRDFVTVVDKNAEKQLGAALANLLPEAGFITEEKVVEQSDKKLKWIIDPLDGTMNYIHGIPIYSISVALMEENEIIIGIVYEINNDEIFYTWKDAPSYMNKKQIDVSGCAVMENALIVTGFPYTRTGRVEGITKTLSYFLERCRDIRRLGSAAVDLCYVASGRIDAYYEGYLNIWDIAAGIIIVKNAGGTTTNFTGEENYNKGNIVAANRIMHPQILKGIMFDK
ncbi:MAG: inositol monophosphatase [Chitinophagales bacterium]|nr:inositol monophosphatase [Chitinophagales bacterium]